MPTSMSHRQMWSIILGIVIVLLFAALGFFFLSAVDEDDDGTQNGNVSSSVSQSSTSSSPTGEISYTTVSEGTNGGSEDRSFRVIVDATGLASLLATMEAAPSLTADFSSSTLVAAFAGRKTTGGHTVEIRSITEQNGVITAGVVETEPGPGCVTTQVITSPYHVVILNRPRADVQFRITTEVRDCSS